MFLVGMLGWWYGDGWQARVHKTMRAIARTAAFFSIGQLFSTLFSPFRQISAGTAGGSIGDQLRGFLDQIVSRAIGSVVRTLVIIAGILGIIFQSVYQLVLIVFWLLLPFLLVAGLLLSVIGWVPVWK